MPTSPPNPAPDLADRPKREQILHGAMQVFLDSGYAGASMDRVAAVAGVSKNTIYSHFQDKEGLFTALIEWIAAQRLQSAFGDASLTGEPAVVLSQLAHRILDVILGDRDYLEFLRLIVAESGRFPHLAQLFVRHLPRQGLAILTTYLRSRPELDLPHPEAAARIFLNSLIAFAMTQNLLYGSTIIPLTSQELIDTLVTLLVRQAAPQPRSLG